MKLKTSIGLFVLLVSMLTTAIAYMPPGPGDLIGPIDPGVIAIQKFCVCSSGDNQNCEVAISGGHCDGKKICGSGGCTAAGTCGDASDCLDENTTCGQNCIEPYAECANNTCAWEDTCVAETCQPDLDSCNADCNDAYNSCLLYTSPSPRD